MSNAGGKREVARRGPVMLAEFNLFGVLIAPIAIYALFAIPLTLMLRFIIWRVGAMSWFWHWPLFQIALYICVLCLMVVYV
ncbi:DUF1656 domain-containing protein [Acetobacteraceae bacterium EV16G]|uniref:DUF1656 domain-containing protein n=2 Tax=Sorlinia euscelidii TaxID=3081148 RepID=A0ABU7U025_9PROT